MVKSSARFAASAWGPWCDDDNTADPEGRTRRDGQGDRELPQGVRIDPNQSRIAEPARHDPRRRLRAVDADQPDRGDLDPRAATADGAAVGQGTRLRDREGDPRLGSAAEPAEPGWRHPDPDPGAERAAAEGPREGHSQARRG